MHLTCFPLPLLMTIVYGINCREIDELSSKKRQEDQAITVAPSRSDISQKLHQLVTSLDSSKCDFGNPNVSVVITSSYLYLVSGKFNL